MLAIKNFGDVFSDLIIGTVCGNRRSCEHHTESCRWSQNRFIRHDAECNMIEGSAPTSSSSFFTEHGVRESGVSHKLPPLGNGKLRVPVLIYPFTNLGLYIRFSYLTHRTPYKTLNRCKSTSLSYVIAI